MEGGPYGGTYIGPKAVLDGVLQRIGTEWEDFACTPDQFYAAGDTIAVTAWYSGRYKATNKDLRCRVTHIWQLKDGEIVGFEQFADTAVLQQATMKD